MGTGATDRAPVANLRIADPTGGVEQQRMAGDHGRALVDPAVGGPATDPQPVVGLEHLIEAVEVLDVDQQARRGEAELEQRQEAVAAGQDLGLALAAARIWSASWIAAGRT